MPEGLIPLKVAGIEPIRKREEEPKAFEKKKKGTDGHW